MGRRNNDIQHNTKQWYHDAISGPKLVVYQEKKKKDEQLKHRNIMNEPGDPSPLAFSCFISASSVKFCGFMVCSRKNSFCMHACESVSVCPPSGRDLLFDMCCMCYRADSILANLKYFFAGQNPTFCRTFLVFAGHPPPRSFHKLSCLGDNRDRFLCHSETDKCQRNMLQTCEELALTIYLKHTKFYHFISKCKTQILQDS